MDDVNRLLAEQACAQLIIGYARLLDAGDWDAVADLYIEEGRMSRPTAPDDFTHGRAAILAGFKARPPRASRHICANISIEVLGAAEARAVSQILLFTGEASVEGGLPQQSALPPMVGTYQDRLVKTAQGWRFAERRGALDFAPAKQG